MENFEVRVKKKKKKEKRRQEMENTDEFHHEDTSYSEDQSPSRKKKKSLVKFENEEETPSYSEDYPALKKKKKSSVKVEVEADEELHSSHHEEDEEIKGTEDTDFYGGWSREDLQELFKKMESVIPKNDTLKYNSRVKKIKWESVKVGSYSAKECHDKWMFIEKRLRGYRVLGELLSDANQWLEKPWTHFYRSVKNNRHPDRPKRPLSSYMIFYLAKKKKYSKKYPSLEMSQLSKIIGEKFKNLPEDKKEKYNKLAAAMREEYQEKMEKFFGEHPSEVKPKADSKKLPVSRSGPKKPLTPFKMFLQDKIKQIDGIKTQTDLTEIQQQCKAKWESMSSKKKIPWIRWAHEAEVKYLEETKIYSSENPDFIVGPHKSVLSKKEKTILERMNGKPEKPPRSAYSLYSRIMLNNPKLKEKYATPKERLQEIARLWKEVPKIEREEYADKVKHLMEEYKMEYAAYLENLPEDKREQELASTGTEKKKVDTKKDTAAKEAKKLKQVTINSVLKNLLPEKTDSSKKIKTLDELIKQEPPQPPNEPFTLFKDECLSQGISEKRAAKNWSALSSLEKAKYDEKLDKLKTDYISKFRNYLLGLKPEEIDIYSVYRNKKMKEAEKEESDEDEEVDSEPDSSSSSSDEAGDSDGS